MWSRISNHPWVVNLANLMKAEETMSDLNRRTIYALIGMTLLIASSSQAQHATHLPALPDWVLQADTASYGPDNLYSLIDGAADAYLGSGFVELKLGTYRNQTGIQFRLELYREDSEINAFGIYAQERKPDYHFVAGLGSEGYDAEDIVNFLHGSLYVKISTQDTGRAAHERILEAARIVSSVLGVAPSMPEEFKFFPTTERVMRSEGYIAHDFLGYRALGNAFFAQYKGKPEYQLFIIKNDDAAGAASRLEAYLSAIHQKPSKTDITYTDRHNGRIGIAVNGRYLAGVVGIENPKKCAEKVRELLKKLP